VSFSVTGGRKVVREMAAETPKEEEAEAMELLRVEEGSRYHVKWS
jgi:hypothetical protein